MVYFHNSNACIVSLEDHNNNCIQLPDDKNTVGRRKKCKSFQLITIDEEYIGSWYIKDKAT